MNKCCFQLFSMQTLFLQETNLWRFLWLLMIRDLRQVLMNITTITIKNENQIKIIIVAPFMMKLLKSSLVTLNKSSFQYQHQGATEEWEDRGCDESCYLLVIEHNPYKIVIHIWCRRGMKIEYYRSVTPLLSHLWWNDENCQQTQNFTKLDLLPNR